MKEKGLQTKTIHVKLIGDAPLKRNGVMGTRSPRPRTYGVGEIPEAITYQHVENLMHYEPGQPHLVWPSANIEAFFTKEKSGAINRYEGRKGKALANKAQAKIFIDPEYPRLTSGGKPVVPNGFDGDGLDKKANMRADVDKAIVKNGFVITVRPVLLLPWEIEFDITLIPDAEISAEKLEYWLRQGGKEIGFGSYRPKFGRFTVVEFDAA